MKDSSFAILPENEKDSKPVEYKRIGSLLAYSVNNQNQVELTGENGHVTIIFYQEKIVRMIMNPKQKPITKTSMAVIRQPEKVELFVDNRENDLVITSANITITICKTSMQLRVADQNGSTIMEDDAQYGMAFNKNKEIISLKKMTDDDHFYGFGEKTSFLDKRGERMTMWNTDVFAPHNPEIDALYQSIPYFMVIRNGSAHGMLLDNTSKTIFDMKSSNTTYSIKAEVGQLDYYLFCGPTPKAVIEQYTSITGKMPLPPKWSLGYHQSRYSYKSEQEVRNLVENFKTKNIPLDAIYLDIHYMDGYRVFTFDEDCFPNPEKFIKELKSQGVHVVPIVDPGVKEDPEYYMYQDGMRGDRFCKYIDGTIYHGDVWPGSSAFPDFTREEVRKWWGKSHQFYTDLGIEGIWNDMNEPAVFNETKTMDTKVCHDYDGTPRVHREVHNEYALLMEKSTYEGMKENLENQRPFLLTRAGYAGIQRYAAVWTGDNRSFWEHLQMAIPMCLNLGISGVPFCGPDVGGFAHDSNGELLVRWTQFGIFTPYFRNHSELNSIHQEPWSFGETYEHIIKQYIEQRYIWLPYLYTLFQQASATGLPVMRPLVLEYPNDENTFNLSDQFMIGSDLIIAPVLHPGARHRVVYLPKGEWFNYWTDERLAGEKHHLIHAPIDILPIFVKEGAVIPQGRVRRSTKEKEEELLIHIYPSKKNHSFFTYYDDDGNTFGYETGEFFTNEIQCQLKKDKLNITMDTKQDGYWPDWKKTTLLIHGIEEHMDIYFNGRKQKTVFNTNNETIHICVDISQS
ncbi:glycoside hydrolase family 31 protein [Gracilibacillus phocaeensis]|uniref:glycoside hydrolase family 31 protein n=1 Tax=Gracilibacillus phocaeensis TaxID=2042304 RepID=UPI0010325C32|nr:glycoside hydrolase family 31 protein [Gracilibacillus phocaeensis]